MPVVVNKEHLAGAAEPQLGGKELEDLIVVELKR
jgi:hypothetical protein